MGTAATVLCPEIQPWTFSHPSLSPGPDWEWSESRKRAFHPCPQPKWLGCHPGHRAARWGRLGAESEHQNCRQLGTCPTEAGRYWEVELFVSEGHGPRAYSTSSSDLNNKPEIKDKIKDFKMVTLEHWTQSLETARMACPHIQPWPKVGPRESLLRFSKYWGWDTR